jgi:hypothetical protein
MNMSLKIKRTLGGARFSKALLVCRSGLWRFGLVARLLGAETL